MNTEKVDAILEQLEVKAYKDRFRKEFEELTEKIDRLSAYIEGRKSNLVGDGDKRLIPLDLWLKIQQLKVMEEYREILLRRSEVEDIPIVICGKEYEK